MSPSCFTRRPVRALTLAVAVAIGSSVVGSAALAAPPAAQQTSSPAADVTPPVTNSALDAPLFYQLLIGEMELRGGDAGTAFQVMLDAARRTKDEQLFRRAVDIALQARAGEQAYNAVAAWREALPQSQEALRYQVQMMVAMSRSGEAQEPLSRLLELSAADKRASMLESLPGLLARNPDRIATAALVERVAKPYADAPATRTAAKVAMGRAWLSASDPVKALAYAQSAASDDAAADGPALLALDLMPSISAAESIVRAHLAARPDDTGVRLYYVRALATTQRFADAAVQLDSLTKSQPDLAPPWLTLGALELELKHPAEATVALKNYVRLIEAGGNIGTPSTPSVNDDDDDAPASPAQALTQAWLLLAQAAEQQKDFKGAEAWLAKIESPQRALEVQARRASLMARQGKVGEARELIRKVPEQGPNDVRAKLVAEADLLRGLKQWNEAEKVLAKASLAFPGDTDLVYERAMVDEKLNRLDDMEVLLRKVIELKPDHPHAYNALGYSLAERKLRLPEARQLIQKALELSPGEPFITDSLGWVEYRLGHKDEAIRLLRGAYQSRPDPEIAAHLGEVLWSAGMSDEARRVWREGRSKDSANDVLRETLARLRVDL